MKRLILHIAVRWHIAMATRAASRARLHSQKCMLAQIMLDALDLKAGGE